MSQLITGIFHDRTEAEQAVDDLKNLGYSQNDISVMMNNSGEAHDFAEGTGTKATEGAGVGAGIGGTLGAIIAALTATGSVAAIAATGGLAAPLVAGPLAAALAGAGAGGLTGGIIGGLIGAGIPEDRARQYETSLNSGGILLGVHAEDAQVPEVQRILERDGADDVQGADGSLGTAPGNTATQTDFLGAAPVGVAAGTATDATLVNNDYATPARDVTGDTRERVQLREEELRADKREVQAGEVHVHKDIVTETKSIDVPVTREEIVIERHAVNNSVTGNADFNEKDQEIRIPVMEEQVTIEKTPVVREEVEIGRRSVTETEHLTGTVQREELRVDNQGDVRTAGTADHRDELLDEDDALNNPRNVR